MSDSLDLQQAQSFVLGKDLAGLVAVQVNRKPVGIEPKLFGHLREKRCSVVIKLDGIIVSHGLKLLSSWRAFTHLFLSSFLCEL